MINNIIIFATEIVGSSYPMIRKFPNLLYDAVKLAILRKKYEIDSVINQLMCEMPQFEFEKIKGLLLFRIEELKRLER